MQFFSRRIILMSQQNGDTVRGNKHDQGNIIGSIAAAVENDVSDEKINHCCDHGGMRVVNEDIVMAHDGR